jgi:hypothetical protein
MIIKWLAPAFLWTGLVACGGGSGGGGSSGLDRDKTIGELDAAEAMDLCEFIASTLPEQRTVTCDGQTIDIGFDAAEIEEQIEECTLEVASLDGCQATVADAEDCASGQAGLLDGLTDDEICELIFGEGPQPPAACEALDDPTCSEDDGPAPPP